MSTFAQIYAAIAGLLLFGFVVVTAPEELLGIIMVSTAMATSPIWAPIVLLSMGYKKLVRDTKC